MKDNTVLWPKQGHPWTFTLPPKKPRPLPTKLRSHFFQFHGSSLTVFLGLSVLLTQVPTSQAEVPPYNTSSATSAILKLDTYLEQVREKNQGLKSELLASEGAALRADEAELLLSPTAFANATLISDARLTPPVFLSYERQIIKNFSFGVSQQTTFGMEARLRYDISTLNYSNPQLLLPIPGGGSTFPFQIANASPILELRQSLWSNGFGRSTRAQQDLLEAQALASSHLAKSNAQRTLVQAETTYWRLALSRQASEVLTQALDRAKKIHARSQQRMKLQLGDKSDVLQSEALVEARALELTGAKNEERLTARDFNSARNVDRDTVDEQLAPLDPTWIDQIKIPERSGDREDVKALQQRMRASEANALVSLERDLPTLDVVGQLALNGQRDLTIYGDLSDAIGASFTLNRPTQMVGLRFSMPLSLGTSQKARQGWRQEKVAAELRVERALFDQEQQWKSLVEQLEGTRKHFELSLKLETIQLAKLENEKIRLQQGRTTTYQVLRFEQDYLLTQLTRIRDQASLLSIVAQMKLFGDLL